MILLTCHSWLVYSLDNPFINTVVDWNSRGTWKQCNETVCFLCRLHKRASQLWWNLDSGILWNLLHEVTSLWWAWCYSRPWLFSHGSPSCLSSRHDFSLTRHLVEGCKSPVFLLVERSFEPEASVVQGWGAKWCCSSEEYIGIGQRDIDC